jgi:hypothetical protein
MSDDPRIQWTLANSYGIWMSDNSEIWFPAHVDSPVDAWNAGRATDVLIRPDGNLVLTSDNGGIWLMSDSGNGTVCVSDRWEDAAFNSLALGPHGDDHVFAGGANAALYMTDLSNLLPMLDWFRLNSLPTQMTEVGTVRDIVILRGSQVIVLACDGGIYWSRIGPPPAKFGPSGVDSFTWRQAIIEGKLSGGFYSIAEGPARPGPQPHPTPDGPIMETVMAGGRGVPGPAGLFFGQWDTPDSLVFRQSHLFNLSSDVTLVSALMGFSVVTSFALNRNIGYAACTNASSDILFSVFKTKDGGRTWIALDPKMPGLDPKKDFADAFGTSQQGHNLCIAVSNTNSDIVTLGFRNGAISFDGGQHWRKPGFDPTQTNSVTDHLHPDLTNFAFSQSITTQPLPAESYYVASDGGVAQVRWGEGAWVIESDVTEGESQGNLYAVILDGNNLVLHVRHSGGAKNLQWEAEAVITSMATGRGCIIQSTFASGDSGNGNLEVIVPENTNLVHYWCAIQNGQYTNWIEDQVITPFATGPGCLIQSTMGTGSQGNFEVVALEGADLVHYWRDNGSPGFPWHRAATISSSASSPGCLIQSDFRFGDNGNLEVVLVEGTDLVHRWHDSSSPGAPWNAATFIHQADSAACFFQSDYPGGTDHGNFELVFRLDNVLMHCFRNNSAPGLPWSAPVPITAPGRKASGPGCVFQGNYGSNDAHGNFELLVPEGAAVVHYFRDNGRAGFPWFPTTTVATSTFTIRSDCNRKLATLEFFPTFGASMLANGALLGALQDNGVVDGVAGDGGTPWFHLEGGDGIAGFYLSGHSPKIAADLAAGLTAVHQNNAVEGDLTTIAGSKSAHFQAGARTLVPDNHGKSGNVIPLLVPKPGITPSPAPEVGLDGAGSAYAMVRSPENFPKSSILAALAARGTDVYALLIGQDIASLRLLESLDMHWEFWATLPGITGVNAMACVDGFTAILELAVSGPMLSLSSDLNFATLDLASGNMVSMPVDPAAGTGSASSIAIVSPDEAYAAVSGGILKASSRILCWTGTQWTVRGQPLMAPGETLISVVVDPNQTPATIFAASTSKVYISRDSAKTWTCASLGLPEAVQCQALHWVRNTKTSQVFLATYGRSIWGISTKETW